MPLLAKETTGWYTSGTSHRLFIEGVAVFDSVRGDRVELPPNLTVPQEIDAYLYLAEYFLKKKSRQGIATILYQIRLKPGDYRLADATITTLWKKYLNEEQAAQKSLDSFIQGEKNPYYKSLAKNIYTSLFTESEDEKKSPELVNCAAHLPYYSLCRFFRLQYYLDRTSGKGPEMSRHYVNILRSVSPFFEEESLHSIPFLEEIDEELPPRLAFLGFAQESLNFQRMVLEAERASLGEYSENSLERMSFLQVVAGRWEEASASLKHLLGSSKNRKKSYRNRIYLKLGMIAYLSKDYRDALEAYLNLDFSDWSSLIVHPLLNEPISIPETKDLVALAVWKISGPEAAIQALRSIPKGDRVYQEEVWPRLRIAQLLMDKNPELASRITDEISYLAQSRGWHRLEYTATILQGYIQILVQQFRKSTVEFTKSRGILMGSDTGYSADWLRYTGMVIAHILSGQKAPVLANIQESLKVLKADPPNEDLLIIKNYKPDSFSFDYFVESSLDYLAETGDYKTMMELLLAHVDNTAHLSSGAETGISQIPAVHARFRHFVGFQTHRESGFQDSTYATSREAQSEYLVQNSEKFSSRYDQDVKNPFLVVVSWDKKTYVFKFDPSQLKKSQWSYSQFSTKDPLAKSIQEDIQQFIDGLSNPQTVQIYCNLEGIRLHEHLRRAYKDQAFNLFYRFSVHPQYGKPWNLAPVLWADRSKLTGVQTVDRSTFEGTVFLPETKRLHIWNYKPLSKSMTIWDMEWKNGSDPSTLSFKRVSRRLEAKTIPDAILIDSSTLGEGRNADSSKLLEWSQFWLRAGSSAVFYSRDLDLEKAVPLYRELPVGISAKQDADTLVIVRDLY